MYKIFELKTGSHLYGTNTEFSDEDFAGVFIPSLENYFGLETVRELDLGTVSKLENGKNAPDAIDKKLYEIRTFFKLAIQNSPNIIELVLAGNKNWTDHDNNFSWMIRGNRHLFPWAGCKQKFIGYSKSQMHKMEIKVENYDSFNVAYKWMEDQLYRDSNASVDRKFASSLLAEYRNLNGIGIKFFQSHASIGDINVSLTDKMTKVFNKVTDRISKVGNREELYTKYGYDVKFGMHLIRLLHEGIELYKTSNIEFPLKERELLLDIRNGKYTKEQIIKMGNDLTSELDGMETKLPSKPRYKDIENLLMIILKEHFKARS